MLNITQAQDRIVKFCKQELHKDVAAIKFLKIKQTDNESWSSIIQITEQNEYLSKLGYPPVFDRNIYNIDIDKEGNVTNFCDQKEEKE